MYLPFRKFRKESIQCMHQDSRVWTLKSEWFRAKSYSVIQSTHCLWEQSRKKCDLNRCVRIDEIGSVKSNWWSGASHGTRNMHDWFAFQGWEYAVDFPASFSKEKKWNSCVRRRCWLRNRRYRAFGSWSKVRHLWRAFRDGAVPTSTSVRIALWYVWN